MTEWVEAVVAGVKSEGQPHATTSSSCRRPSLPLAPLLLLLLPTLSLLHTVTCTSAAASHQKPNFVGIIPNVTVTQGRDASLPCVVRDIGDYQVTWMHLNRVMLLTIDETTITLIPRFRVTRDDPSTWTLHIRHVQSEDTGYYVCQVNMEPVINQVGYVKVVVPPQFLDEESSPSHVSVQEGHNVRLMCQASGEPQPTIRWTRQEKLPINTGLGAKVYQVDSEELMLKSVSRKDMGAYYCIAGNKVPPSISKRIVLEVQFQPVISVPTQLVGAPVGTTVTLECKVAAFPNAVHFWRFNGQLLINSSRQETQEFHDGYTTIMKLFLKAIKPRDFGTYVCSAKNSLGETESNVRLYKINVNRGPEKLDVSNHQNEVILPEQQVDRSGLLEAWNRPNEYRSDLDAGSPSFTLEDYSLRSEGPSSAQGGMGTSLSISGRTDYSPHHPSTSSSPNSLTGSAAYLGAWSTYCLITACLRSSTVHLTTLLTDLTCFVFMLMTSLLADFTCLLFKLMTSLLTDLTPLVLLLLTSLVNNLTPLVFLLLTSVLNYIIPLMFMFLTPLLDDLTPLMFLLLTLLLINLTHLMLRILQQTAARVVSSTRTFTTATVASHT